MASPENQHCASCIGTLSFPTKWSVKKQQQWSRNRTRMPVVATLVATSNAEVDNCGAVRRLTGSA